MKPVAGGLIIGGALLVALGSIMPWQEIQSGIFEKTIIGTDKQGLVTLGVAVAMIIAGIVVLVRDSMPARGAAILAALAAFGVGGFTVYDILSRAADVEKLQRVQAALGGTSNASISSSVPGLGLYAVIIGATLAIVGSLLQNQQPSA